MPQNSPVARAAALLAERRRSQLQGDALPTDYLPQDADAALQVQAEVLRLLDLKTLAWKCALPDAGNPILAPITSLHSTSPCSAIARMGMVKIEPELAFVLRHDLPSRAEPYTPQEVDAAIGSVHLALELIDSRYLDHKAAGYLGNLADCLVNQGLLLGPAIANEMSEFTLRIFGLDYEMQMDGKHPAHNPRAPLYWLAEFLRSRGEGLKAGQPVITGSYAGSLEVPIDTELDIVFGEMGSLQVKFRAA